MIKGIFRNEGLLGSVRREVPQVDAAPHAHAHVTHGICLLTHWSCCSPLVLRIFKHRPDHLRQRRATRRCCCGLARAEQASTAKSRQGRDTTKKKKRGALVPLVSVLLMFV